MKKLKIFCTIILCLFLSIDIKALTPNIVMQPGIYGNKVKGS